jgi:hypothetical protein
MHVIEMLFDGYKMEPKIEPLLKPLLPTIIVCFGANYWIHVANTINDLKQHQA